MKTDKYGINMTQWCERHEAYLAANEPSRALLNLHLERLRWLQHERLVHLIVTVMTVFVEVFLVYLVLIHPELGIFAALIMLGVAILLGFYFRHYFFLENTVQHWYRLADEMMERIDS